MPDELLTIAQLARVLDVPAEQILAWRRRDLGPPPVNGAAIPRWDPQAVRGWVDQRIAEEQAG
jgi:hypothetical protein